jgi:hypothetical protein
MGTMLEYIRENSELRNRFVKKAFEQRGITDFGSFKDALINSFDNERGGRASKFFGDEELKELFESEECKSQMRQVMPEEEFNRVYGEWKTEQQQTFVVRREPKGKIVKPREVQVFQVRARTFKVGKYTRQGRAIKGYQRSFKLWQSSQVRFIRERKRQQLSVAKIIWAYNQHFKDNIRSPSSISSKFYRV